MKLIDYLRDLLVRLDSDSEVYNLVNDVVIDIENGDKRLIIGRDGKAYIIDVVHKDARYGVPSIY